MALALEPHIPHSQNKIEEPNLSYSSTDGKRREGKKEGSARWVLCSCSSIECVLSSIDSIKHRGNWRARWGRHQGHTARTARGGSILMPQSVITMQFSLPFLKALCISGLGVLKRETCVKYRRMPLPWGREGLADWNAWLPRGVLEPVSPLQRLTLLKYFLTRLCL